MQKTILFQTIQFSINHLFTHSLNVNSSIWCRDRTLSGATLQARELCNLGSESLIQDFLFQGMLFMYHRPVQFLSSITINGLTTNVSSLEKCPPEMSLAITLIWSILPTATLEFTTKTNPVSVAQALFIGLELYTHLCQVSSVSWESKIASA